MSLRGSLEEATEAISKQGCLMNKEYYIYIMTNKRNNVIYTGVTNDLKRRVFEHKEKLLEGFTKRYSITKFVYYEVCEDVKEAILREKKIKGGSRVKKVALIDRMNKEWKDLYEDII